MNASAQILTLANLLLCIAYGASAACRLAKMHGHVMPRVAAFYVVLFAASAMSGLQYYFFGTFAEWPDLIGSVAVCLALWATMPQWRHGPPPDSCLRA